MLPVDVTSASDAIVEGEVTATSVIERAGMLWTVATLEVHSTAKGSTADEVHVTWLGGSDVLSGRWTEATHSPNLPTGATATVGLVVASEEIRDDVAAELDLGDEPVYQVWAGGRGAISDASESGRDTSAAARYALIGLRWQEMPIEYRINENVSTLLPNAEEIIHRSIDTWTNDPMSDVTFSFEGYADTTDREWPFTNTVFAGDAPGLLGQAVFGGNRGPGIVTAFDIIINNGALVANLPWHDGPKPMTFDLGSVVMHEIGHVLGLDHSEVEGALMFPVLDAGMQIDVPIDDDRAAINELYPAANPPTPTPVPVPTPTPVPTPVPPTPVPPVSTTPSSSCGTPPPGAIIGTSGNDSLFGTAGDDVIFGGAGDDVILGLDGNDIICGGPGNDSLFGQNGNDTLRGDDGDDKLRGGDDQDAIFGGDGSDDLNGGRGNDFVYGENGDDAKVRGGTGDDVVSGGAGNDALIAGNGGADTVHGDDGNDSLISGGPRPDIIYGGAGDDTIKGLGGADTIYGDSGNDELLGGKQPDKVLDGGTGVDICNGGSELTAPGATVNCETSINTVALATASINAA